MFCKGIEVEMVGPMSFMWSMEECLKKYWKQRIIVQGRRRRSRRKSLKVVEQNLRVMRTRNRRQATLYRRK